MQAGKTDYFEAVKRLMLISFGGCLLSLVIWELMGMNYRYAVALTALIVFLSLCAIFVRKLEDFLFYSLVFNIPFAIFEKWFFVQSDTTAPSPGISIGLAGIILLLAYLMWFGQVFITKTKPLPRIGGIDVIIILFIMVQIIASFFALNKLLAIFEIIYTIKHILIYFFIKNTVKRKHLKGIVLLILFTVLFESGFAAFERVSGVANLAATKGDTSSETFGKQYTVPGIEDELRAAGTTNDSHSLGLYFDKEIYENVFYRINDFKDCQQFI